MKEIVKYIDENNNNSLMDITENEDARPTKALEVLEVLERENEVEAKIKEKQLYRKWPGSDTWACSNCNESNDKWYMLEHICKMNKENNNLILLKSLNYYLLQMRLGQNSKIQYILCFGF